MTFIYTDTKKYVDTTQTDSFFFLAIKVSLLGNGFPLGAPYKRQFGPVI